MSRNGPRMSDEVDLSEMSDEEVASELDFAHGPDHADDELEVGPGMIGPTFELKFSKDSVSLFVDSVLQRKIPREHFKTDVDLNSVTTCGDMLDVFKHGGLAGFSLRFLKTKHKIK